MNEDFIGHWVIDDSRHGTEVLYSATDSIDVDKLPDVHDGYILEFNQWTTEETKSACTIVNSVRGLIRTASSYYRYKPTTKDIFDTVDYAIKEMGYIVWSWWWVYKWVDAARRYWNSIHPDMKISSALVEYNDPAYKKFSDKWYFMVGSYKWNYEYWRDFKDNWVLDWYKFVPHSYWHCTIRKVKWSQEVVDDSYFGRKYNEYILKYPKKVIDTGCWSNNFYVFVPEIKNIDEIKRLTKMKNELEIVITNNSLLWNDSNDPVYKDLLEKMNTANREKLAYVNDLLKSA